MMLGTVDRGIGFTCASMRLRACVHASMRACICARVRVCVCVCTCAFAFVCECASARVLVRVIIYPEHVLIPDLKFDFRTRVVISVSF